MIDPNHTFVEGAKAVDAAKQCRFAAPAGAHVRVDFNRIDIETEPAENLKRLVAFDQA